MHLFDGPAPRWFTIPAHRPFLEDLALGLHAELACERPEALTDAVVLTPTRRAARALADAFLKAAGGRPVLLPQLRALGDLVEGEPPFEPGDLTLDLPPAIGVHQRRFELARLVAGHEAGVGRTLDAGAALHLADALGAFLDSRWIEEVEDLSGADDLVDADLAEHWRRSGDFLRLAGEVWPRRLAELGLVDIAARRVALLRALAERWSHAPPQGVLIAAGSTGTAPSTADLLGVVAAAPRGVVVLPGLDRGLAESAWRAIRPHEPQGEQHPQGALSRLLARAGIGREEVRDWPASPETTAGRARRRVVNEALRPAEATADWLAQVRELRKSGEKDGVDPIAQGLDGLGIVTARDENEAAGAIALLLREALETPGRTAALVTPDQALGRRVVAKLTRWGASADVSAGVALSAFPVGVLSSLTARLMDGELDPVGALAVLKHPLVRLGRAPDALRRETVTLERHALRGARPRDWGAVRNRLEAKGQGRRDRAIEDGETEQAAAERLRRYAEAAQLADELEETIAAAAAVFRDGDAPASAAARAHVQALEALAAGVAGGRGPPGPGALWSGAEGEAAAGLFAALLRESDGLPPVSAAGYAELVASMLAGETVRAGGATHPRLRILGAIEARLVRADVMILAGLEEGVWPATPPADPFLSRPMRTRLGLPPPERRVGLAAHDFAQAACAPTVFLVHGERRGGQPAVKSRWLWRLETLARGAEVEILRASDLLAWARALDAPETFRPASRPRPRPPVAARPRRLSVTRVEAWVRDPYAVYAQYVLGLETLARPDEPVGPRERGSALHAAFERFALDHPDDLPDDAEARFEAVMVQALVDAGLDAPAMAREAALARNAAPWAVEMERRRRAARPRLVIECKGALTFEAPAGPFTLTAKADRLEIGHEVGHVIDFKTGALPSKPQIVSGLSPQLPLTAAILAEGGFPDVGPISPGELVYIKITGRRDPGCEAVRAGPGESEALAAAALEGLKRRAAWFDDPKTPYLSRAIPRLESDRDGDFDHLARVWEWAVISSEDLEGEET